MDAFIHEAATLSVASLERCIEKVNERISTLSGDLRFYLQPNAEAHDLISCARIVAAVSSKETDNTTYERICNRLDMHEVWESEILKRSLELLELYVKRAHIRRRLMEKTRETMISFSTPVWRDGDHYMMRFMEMDDKSAFVRLLSQFRKSLELNKVLGLDIPVDLRLEGLDEKIRQCEAHLHGKFKRDDEDETLLSYTSIVSTINDHDEFNITEFGELTQEVEDNELSELETLSSFLHLMDLYIQRGRLRRILVQQAETAKGEDGMTRTIEKDAHKLIKPGNMSEESDHYMIGALKGDNKGLLIKLIAGLGDEDGLEAESDSEIGTEMEENAENAENEENEESD
ncbi:hypothetical protein E8E13_003220 [Curvularia kusanoi]|uniref:Uncharacterized protein n=1 Tax=Curvularia kusanoi TaxID=90978 RepID=A0A9P4T567_CURKU|nr:hypothetical protein E8E13_003220 [Curvularia kusanoi]